jgi:hypothetical protein
VAGAPVGAADVPHNKTDAVVGSAAGAGKPAKKGAVEGSEAENKSLIVGRIDIIESVGVNTNAS